MLKYDFVFAIGKSSHKIQTILKCVVILNKKRAVKKSALQIINQNNYSIL
jgi:hypothetical protein